MESALKSQIVVIGNNDQRRNILDILTVILKDEIHNTQIIEFEDGLAAWGKLYKAGRQAENQLPNFIIAPWDGERAGGFFFLGMSRKYLVTAIPVCLIVEKIESKDQDSIAKYEQAMVASWSELKEVLEILLASKPSVG